jgi:hypothetical protein
MDKRLAFASIAALTLFGCCPGPDCYLVPTSTVLTHPDEPRLFAERKHVRVAKARKKADPPPPDEDARREAELSKLKPYSEQWWSVQDAIEQAAEAKLAKRLIICQGCMVSAPADETGSIADGTSPAHVK